MLSSPFNSRKKWRNFWQVLCVGERGRMYEEEARRWSQRRMEGRIGIFESGHDKNFNVTHDNCQPTIVCSCVVNNYVLNKSDHCSKQLTQTLTWRYCGDFVSSHPQAFFIAVVLGNRKQEQAAIIQPESNLLCLCVRSHFNDLCKICFVTIDQTSGQSMGSLITCLMKMVCILIIDASDCDWSSLSSITLSLNYGFVDPGFRRSIYIAIYFNIYYPRVSCSRYNRKHSFFSIICN